MTIIMAAVLSISFTAHAKLSPAVWGAIEEAYKPAVWNEGLGTAYVNPDPSKFRNYVVVTQGGIAAERAKRLISWAEYDYRGTTVNVSKGTVKTRRGSKYTYLQPGDVMAVASLSKLGNRVYVNIISPEIYKPLNRPNDKKFSRVTASVIFKLPKELAEIDDPGPALQAMGDWLRPYNQQPMKPSTEQQKKYPLSTSPERPNPYEPPGVRYTKPSY